MPPCLQGYSSARKHMTSAHLLTFLSDVYCTRAHRFSSKHRLTAVSDHGCAACNLAWMMIGFWSA